MTYEEAHDWYTREMFAHNWQHRPFVSWLQTTTRHRDDALTDARDMAATLSDLRRNP